MKRICSILLFTVMLFSVSFGTLSVSAAGGDSPSEAFYTRFSAQGLRELLRALKELRFSAGYIKEDTCKNGCLPSPEETEDKAPEPETKPEQTKPSDSGKEDGSAVSSYEKQVAEIVNRYRAQYGLSALTLNTQLCELSDRKSEDMRAKNYFAHESPTYGSAFDMMKAAGIRYRYAGENLAMGYDDPETVVRAWMNSEGHRKNILSPNFQEIGVGYVENGGYWTQMFIG